MFAFRRRRCARCDVQLALDDGTLCAECIAQQLDAERAAREEIELAHRHAMLAKEDAERRAKKSRANQD